MAIKFHADRRQYEREKAALRQLSSAHVPALEEPLEGPALAALGLPPCLVMEAGRVTLAHWLRGEREGGGAGGGPPRDLLAIKTALHQVGGGMGVGRGSTPRSRHGVEGAAATPPLRLPPRVRLGWASRRLTAPRRPRAPPSPAQVLAALVHLHSRRTVHRDIKPSNIMWFEDSHRFKLIDLAESASLGEVAPPCVTPLYSPPEQLAAALEGAPRAAPVTPAADMWSFGVLAFEALSGLRYWGPQPSLASVLEAAFGHGPLPSEEGGAHGAELACLEPAAARRLVSHLLLRPPGPRWSAATCYRNALFASGDDTDQRARAWEAMLSRAARQQQVLATPAAEPAVAHFAADLCIHEQPAAGPSGPALGRVASGVWPAAGGGAAGSAGGAAPASPPPVSVASLRRGALGGGLGPGAWGLGASTMGAPTRGGAAGSGGGGPQAPAAEPPAAALGPRVPLLVDPAAPEQPVFLLSPRRTYTVGRGAEGRWAAQEGGQDLRPRAHACDAARCSRTSPVSSACPVRPADPRHAGGGARREPGCEPPGGAAADLARGPERGAAAAPGGRPGPARPRGGCRDAHLQCGLGAAARPPRPAAAAGAARRGAGRRSRRGRGGRGAPGGAAAAAPGGRCQGEARGCKGGVTEAPGGTHARSGHPRSHAHPPRSMCRPLTPPSRPCPPCAQPVAVHATLCVLLLEGAQQPPAAPRPGSGGSSATSASAPPRSASSGGGGQGVAGVAAELGLVAWSGGRWAEAPGWVRGVAQGATVLVAVTGAAQ